ncbi:MAG: pilus assembly protein TadE, partial [Novosphingobium sp.]
INTIMAGVASQGSSFSFSTRGRIILSSLEKDPTTGKQFIHWQRCTGSLAAVSAYGNDSTRNGLNGPTITSLGQGATKITANTGVAVMFVEVFYQHRGLFGTMFIQPTTFKQEAAFIVRDVRDLRASNLSGITGTGSTAQCS